MNPQIGLQIQFLLLFFVAWVTPCLAEVTRSHGRIAEGTDWETQYFVIDSGNEGPTVLILGGMHGNEPAGALAASQIRHWPIVKGKLVVIPQSNVLALKANSRLTPDQPKEEGNLNRNFPEAGSKSSVAPRGELAAALWRFAIKLKPDWVIDLHEGFEFNISHKPPKGEKKSVGSSVIYEGSAPMDLLAKRVVEAANATVTDPNKRFSLIRRGPVDTSLAQACIKVFGAEGLILETTFKNQPMSLRAQQHRIMVDVLLNHVGTVDQKCRDILTAPGSQNLSD